MAARILPKSPKSGFTDAWLKNLKPNATRYEVLEAGRTGLRARVAPAGAITFYWLGRDHKGKQKRVNLGRYPDTSLAEARKRLEAARKTVASAGGEFEIPADVEALAELFYRVRIVPHRGAPWVVRQVLDYDIIPTLGKRKLGHITTPVVASVVDRAVARGAATHAGKVLAILKQLFSFAKGRGYLAENPAADLRAKDLGVIANTRERTLSLEEIAETWDGLDAAPRLSAQIRLGLKVLLLTGVRSGELRLARWEQVDFDAARWHIPAENTKTGAAWTVPLAPMVAELLRELGDCAQGSPWVMPGKQGEPLSDKAMARAVKRLFGAGVLTGQGWVPHDCRRTVRTHLSKMGVPPHIAEKCLNHSLGRIEATYDRHDYLEERREALERWAEQVARMVGLMDSTVVELRA